MTASMDHGILDGAPGVLLARLPRDAHSIHLVTPGAIRQALHEFLSLSTPVRRPLPQ